MIAISLLLIGFMGTFTLINRSLGLTRVVADSYTGTYLAAEGVEVIKSLIDANYLAGRPFFDGFESCIGSGCAWELDRDATWESNLPREYDATPLWLDPVEGLYSYEPFGTPTSFTRRVTVALGGTGGRELHVTSRVEWRARGGGTSAVTLEDRFYDWYLLLPPATSTPPTP